MATMEKPKLKQKKKKTRLKSEDLLEETEVVVEVEVYEPEQGSSSSQIESPSTSKAEDEKNVEKDIPSTSKIKEESSVEKLPTPEKKIPTTSKVQEKADIKKETPRNIPEEHSQMIVVSGSEEKIQPIQYEKCVPQSKTSIELEEDLDMGLEINVPSSSSLTKAAEGCRELSDSVANLIQPIPEDYVVPKANIETEKPKTYKELNALVSKLKYVTFTRERTSLLTPFKFEEIESLFGVKELAAARRYTAEFETNEMQAPVTSHPLYEALTEYQRTRSQQIYNQREAASLLAECADKQNTIWMIKNCIQKAGGRCSDGCYLDSSHCYQDAVLQKSLFTEFQRSLTLLREKATEIHSLHSHGEYLHKIQVEELIWTSIVSGVSSIKDAMRIIFWVLRTSAWGYDRELRKQLRIWSCSLATTLLQLDDGLDNVLFLLNHILRVTQGIKWSFHLIKCSVNSSQDISKALSLLEVILSRSAISQKNKKKLNDKPSEVDSELLEDSNVPTAAEATDDSLWLVVDSDGEGADLEACGARGTGVLRENDILGLIKQIPFEKIFQELMVVKNDGHELVFCGAKLNGGPVLRVFASARMMLSIIRVGLISHQEYQELTKELCRLALHTMKYCTDLWEVAKSNCEENLLERLMVEYDCVFQAGWSTLECAGSKDTAYMFLSEIPFAMVYIDTVHQIYSRIAEHLIVSDSVWCYYVLVSIANMAIYRTEEDFALTIIRHLYEIGFTSDNSNRGCGEWARTLCGSVLTSKPHLTGELLLGAPLPPILSPSWLLCLPLQRWKPSADQLVELLNKWKTPAPNLVQYLLKGMNWNINGGVDIHTHRSVAMFISKMAQKLMKTKSPFPEWVWECLIPLKLHCYDWGLDFSRALPLESIQGLDMSGKCPASVVTAVLCTSISHTVPQIFLQAAPLLVKLAGSGRFTEVTHILNYAFPILRDCPMDVFNCSNFRDLLAIMIRAEKTYTKMATRLVIGDYAGPVVKLLVSVMQAQLKNYKSFGLESVRSLLMVWVHWLTSVDGWYAEWVTVHLLDVALGCCFLHYDAFNDAAGYLTMFIQKISVARSPSSSSGFSWLWSSGSGNRGLLQCSVEAPYMWHATLWSEHALLERQHGLWQRLQRKLEQHKAGTKVNLDRALKSVGGPDNSGGLVIYRSLQCAISLSLGHPIYSLVWQIFFYLYIDATSLESMDSKPVGPLFFEGLVNSRLLVRAKARLVEAENFHKAKAIELCDDPNGFRSRSNEKQWFHECQTQLMKAFQVWLDDDVYTRDLSKLRPYNNKFEKLREGNNDMWMDTVNLQDLRSLQPALWPAAIMPSSSIYSISTNTRAKTPESTARERILSRLKTYEKPATDSVEYKADRLEPLVDPRLSQDFSKVHKLMKDHLKFLEKCAKKYDNTTRYLSSIDGNLCDLIPALYEKRDFCKKIQKVCGEKCLGKAEFMIKCEESKVKEDVKIKIGYNRTTHKTALEKAMKPYDDVATHTAIITKLAQLAYNGQIPNLGDEGVQLFNTVLSAIKDENTQFPPASQVLVNVATQLGEKFVTNSGVHCEQLVGKVRGAESIGLVGTLLRPSQLPTAEMIKVYAAISIQVKDTRVAFSYLSKFHISGWLYDVRPTVMERSRFISLLCEGLGMSGYEPQDDRLILHELMCVHLSKVLAWEFPVHLSQVLGTLCSLSLERKLPPNTWQHCITIIETYPHLLLHHQACESMELIGRQWWSKRGSCGPNGLYSAYGAYASQMGRLGALLASTVLSTAMLHSPPLLTKQICTLVTTAMFTFWDVWLVPWWGGGSQVAPWVGDLARGACLMPWGAEDQDPKSMLDALVETLHYCASTLPGSINDLLGMTWQWYARNFPHSSIPPHVLSRVHTALARLPWTVFPEYWITFPDLQTIAQVRNINLASCNAFMVQCMGSRRWGPWLEAQPPPLHPAIVHLLLPLLLTLDLHQQVLDDALNLPWKYLSEEAFKASVTWVVSINNSTTQIFHSNRLVPLLCAVGGLVSGGEVGIMWSNKRSDLVKAWVTATATTSCSGVAGSIRDLLQRIQDTTMSLGTESTAESEKLAEGSALISNAVLMMNMMVLSEVAQEEWIKWVNSTTKLCLMSLISCLYQVTQRDIFGTLGEHTILAFFEHEGEWNYIIDKWRNNCIVSVEYLIGFSCPLTALATYKAADRSKFQGSAFNQLDKSVLQALHGFDPECSNERQCSLWVCYCVWLAGDHSMDRAGTLGALHLLHAVLERWAQEPSWGLLKAIRLVENKAPSHKFRIIARYALCLILAYQQKIRESSPSQSGGESSSYGKSLAALEAMLDQKPYTDNRITLGRCLHFLKHENNTIQDSLKSVSDLCSQLYTDVNYLYTTCELFKM